jgi:Uma2 family endonuclease
MQETRSTRLTPEEYLSMERQADIKSEYFNGEVFAMAGASLAHIQISANVVTALNTRFKGRPCRALGSDMRVKVRQTSSYAYPDIVVVCGQLRFEDRKQDTLLNPTVIFEVLSSSTERYDRGGKFAHYRTLESLTDYVLISQTEARIEHFARQPAEKWLLSVYSGLDAIATLPSIGCELPSAEVYDKVEFPRPGSIPLRIVREHQSEYEYDDDAYASHPPYPNNDC